MRSQSRLCSSSLSSSSLSTASVARLFSGKSWEPSEWSNHARTVMNCSNEISSPEPFEVCAFLRAVT
jgi:hypothetical protein